MISRDQLIIADGQYYSRDCFETQLNNNVLVVGSAGSGKTRSIVSPNILQATGSYIITDPKGQLHKKYGKYLRDMGYWVRVLDFTHPARSRHYNIFNYINSTQDIMKLAHMIMDGSEVNYKGNAYDPFWDEMAEILLTALMGYLWLHRPKHEQTLETVLKLVAACQIEESNADAKTPLDRIFDEVAKVDKRDFSYTQYQKFRIGAAKTLRSVLISLNAKLGRFDFPELREMMKDDDLELWKIGARKTALFVVVSDKDRCLDGLINIFYSQAMEELCRVADDTCEDGALKIPVQFILDDFATNCKIADFPKMISSIRSRGISTMLILQAESQLEQCYGVDGRTIIANCDTYVYLGGNDLETATAVATRCDLPVKKILYMPVGTNWIFRRGQYPINGKNFELEPFEKERLEEAQSRRNVTAGRIA